MSELKTLKDLIRKSEWFCGGVEVISFDELRAEAVKWVKYWDEISHYYITPKDWMEFFNLTEEDLE